MGSDSLDWMPTFISALTLVGFLCGFLIIIVIIDKKMKMSMMTRIRHALKKRRYGVDQFRAENGYSWDYCFAFKVYDDNEAINDYQSMYSMKYVLTQLSTGGLEFRLFYNVNFNQVFCKVRAPLKVLKEEASRIKYQLPADPVALRELCKKGRDGLWSGLKIPDEAPDTKLDPYEHIYLPYTYDPSTANTEMDLEQLIKKWPIVTVTDEIKTTDDSDDLGNLGDISMKDMTVSPLIETDATKNFSKYKGVETAVTTCIFHGVDRLKLIHSKITSHNVGGCYLDPLFLLKEECILGYFPLHDIVELRLLQSQWLTIFAAPYNQPYDLIKNYFGEKISLYFLWVGRYTTWLISASIFGFAAWVNVAAENNNPSVPILPYFAGFMAVWATLFIENWKRTENVHAMKWGMVGFEATEQNRPAFNGINIFIDIYFLYLLTF
jgi:hypothetical protein